MLKKKLFLDMQEEITDLVAKDLIYHQVGNSLMSIEFPKGAHAVATEMFPV